MNFLMDFNAIFVISSIYVLLCIFNEEGVRAMSKSNWWHSGRIINNWKSVKGDTQMYFFTTLAKKGCLPE